MTLQAIGKEIDIKNGQFFKLKMFTQFVLEAIKEDKTTQQIKIIAETMSIETLLDAIETESNP